MSTYEETRVLVIDDHQTMLRIITNLLHEIGFQDITTASSGVEALEKLKAKPFDLVLSDWNMEPMDGLALLKFVRAAKNEKFHSVPFILVTAESKKENIIEAKKAGVDNYVIKPFNKEVLEKKISSVMHKRGEAA